MNHELIRETARRTLAGQISFPDVVGNLLIAGVESYHVDYVGRRKVYYAADGRSVAMDLALADLPPVGADFDHAAVKATILDSQRHGQHFRDFTRRVMAAGVQGYHAFLRGRRVIYFGRQGDLHTEWFPGAAPAARV